MRVGPAAGPTSDMGPMIDKANVEHVNQMVDDALAAGAKAIVQQGSVTEGPLARGPLPSDVVRGSGFACADRARGGLCRHVIGWLGQRLEHARRAVFTR